MMSRIECPFDLGDKVCIDGGNIAAVIVGIAFYPSGAEVKVSWWNAGNLCDAWVAAWRCSPVIA